MSNVLYHLCSEWNISSAHAVKLGYIINLKEVIVYFLELHFKLSLSRQEFEVEVPGVAWYIPK